MNTTNPAEEPSPQVLDALERLENATSPTELGEAYQTVLDWKRKTLGWRFEPGQLLIAIALCAGIVLLPLIPFDLSEYSRGALFGASIVMFVQLVFSFLDRLTHRQPPPPSLHERAQTALDRWRHAVPAMREIPK